MDENWILPAGKLAARMGLPRVLSACPAPMGEGEEGYSGAALFQLRAGFAGGGEGSFVCKKTSLKEREATGRLFLQGRGYTPAALSCGPDGEGEGWMIMEDIGRKAPLPEDRARWKRQAAEAFAAIHMDNFGKGAEMPWLPAADAEYWDFFTHALSAGHFERFCREDEAFAAEYGGKLPALREAAASFSAGMAALFEAGTANTLTHGDVQTMGAPGGHRLWLLPLRAPVHRPHRLFPAGRVGALLGGVPGTGTPPRKTGLPGGLPDCRPLPGVCLPLPGADGLEAGGTGTAPALYAPFGAVNRAGAAGTE